MSASKALIRWGPFEGCAVVDNDRNCYDRSSLDDSPLLRSEPMSVAGKPSLGKPSCGDPVKRLNHAGSTSTLSFPGVSSETSRFFNPYSSIAVGKNYILQAAGTQIAVYDKKEGRHYASIPVGDNIFYNTVAEEVLAVLYDPYSDRFVIAVTRVRNTDDPRDVVEPYIAFAITKGSNPLSDGWYRYMLPLPISTGKLTRLKLGAWHNGIYLSIGLDNSLARIAIIDREPILYGSPLVALYLDIGGSYVVNVMPPNASITLPPQSENGYFMNFGLTSLRCFECAINWKKFAGQVRRCHLLPKGYAATDGTVGQKEVNVKIAYGPSYSTGAQMQAQYSHINNKSSYWVSATNGNKGLIWLEVGVKSSGELKILQQQTIPNADGFQRFSPGMAVNKSGNVALVATQSSATTFPATVYFYRFASDPPNLMTKETPLITWTGSNPDVRYLPDKTTWGFTSAQVDPEDATTFFVSGEGYKTSTSDWWSTTINNLKL